MACRFISHDMRVVSSAMTGVSFHQPLQAILIISHWQYLDHQPQWVCLQAILFISPNGHVLSSAPTGTSYHQPRQALLIISPDRRFLSSALIGASSATVAVSWSSAPMGMSYNQPRRKAIFIISPDRHVSSATMAVSWSLAPTGMSYH